MNCAEVQNRAVEFLDRSLDAITAKHLEIHLSSCPPCRTEVDSLADCIQQVAALPIVDPPLGFAQRVMAHAREIERKPSIWQRVLFPMRLDKSIQAAAVVLIAVFAFYLHQKNSPSLMNPAQPVTSTTHLAALADQQKEVPNTVRPAAKSVPDAVQATARARQEAPARTPTPAPASPAAPISVPPPASNTENEARSEIERPAPRRAPIQVQEVAAGRDNPRAARESFGPGDLRFGAALQPSFRAAPASASRPLFSMSEPIADFEFIVRRRPAQVRERAEAESTDSPRKTSEADAGAQTAAVHPPEPFFSAMVVETRWYTVAQEHLDYFKKDLAAETVIESERSSTRKEQESGSHPLAIKVIILPPADR